MAQPVESVGSVARPLQKELVPKNLLHDFTEVEEVVSAKQDYPIMEDGLESQWRTEAFEPPGAFWHSQFLGLEEKESKSPLAAEDTDAWC